MNKIRKMLAIILLSALVFCAACGKTAQSDPLSYQHRAGRWQLTGELCGVAFEAVLALGEDPAGGGSRDLLLTYSAPEALAGVTVRREGGVWGASCGGVSFSGGEAEAFGLPAEAFEAEGEAVFLGTEQDGADRVSVFSVTGPDGSAARVTLCGDAPRAITLTLPDGRTAALRAESLPAE